MWGPGPQYFLSCSKYYQDLNVEPWGFGYTYLRASSYLVFWPLWWKLRLTLPQNIVDKVEAEKGSVKSVVGEIEKALCCVLLWSTCLSLPAHLHIDMILILWQCVRFSHEVGTHQQIQGTVCLTLQCVWYNRWRPVQHRSRFVMGSLSLPPPFKTVEGRRCKIKRTKWIVLCQA